MVKSSEGKGKIGCFSKMIEYFSECLVGSHGDSTIERASECWRSQLYYRSMVAPYSWALRAAVVLAFAAAACQGMYLPGLRKGKWMKASVTTCIKHALHDVVFCSFNDDLFRSAAVIRSTT